MKENYLNLISQQKYIFHIVPKTWHIFYCWSNKKMWAVSQPQSENVNE